MEDDRHVIELHDLTDKTSHVSQSHRSTYVILLIRYDLIKKIPPLPSYYT
jgi:hypothetical protein